MENNLSYRLIIKLRFCYPSLYMLIYFSGLVNILFENYYVKRIIIMFNMQYR